MSTGARSSGEELPEARTPSARQRVLVAMLVFAGFAIFAVSRNPAPGVNEPHYLCKARHYWDPSWCERDPFLQSANAHAFFYATLGALTQWLTLSQTAWVGRIIGWLILAGGWSELCFKLLPSRWGPLWSAAVLLLLTSSGSYSGEWMLGGIEAKVFSYGFLFWSLSFVCGVISFSGPSIDHRAPEVRIDSKRHIQWMVAGSCAGLAVGFHPIIGVWNVAAICFAVFCGVMGAVRKGSHERTGARASNLGLPDTPSTAGSEAMPERRTDAWVGILLALVCLAVFSLPGVIAALRVVGHAPPQTVYEADYIQVFYRLAHHLDPRRFSIEGVVKYLFFVALWVWMRGRASFRRPEPYFAAYVWGTILIALLGAFVGFVVRDAALMKFYPFRLADIMVPAAVAVASAGCVIRWLQRPSRATAPVYPPAELDDPKGALSGVSLRSNPGHPNRANSHILHTADTGTPARSESSRTGVVWLGFAAAFIISLAVPTPDRNPGRMSSDRFADWREVCSWVKANTPHDALFLTANERWGNSWAFKWFAERAEFVSHKDCPQDAEGIVAWNERLRLLGRWNEHYYQAGYSVAALQALRKETGIDYLVVGRVGPFESKPIYHNRAFSVYKLPDED